MPHDISQSKACRDWQKEIQYFLDDKLEIHELEAFIKHVRACKNCYEELEIMFMLSRALEELDSEYTGTYNFRAQLEKKLSDSQMRWERYQNFEKMKRMIYCLMNVMVIIGMIVQIMRWF